MDRAVARKGDRGGERTLPVNLLVKGRLCLLVGAGHVAERKAKSLLSHGARVVLVAPDAVDELRDLASTGEVVLREERYDSALLTELDPFLVYAATDDDELNRRIAIEANQRGLLVSSVSCWEEGDFISPSVIPWGRGQVSVTTEGASCRQAKFMRLRLQELLGGKRLLILLGVDQRSLTLEEFERIRPDADRAHELVGMLRHLAALEEFVLLPTCNRLELYAWTRRGDALESAVRGILGLGGDLADRVYVKSGEEVVRHAANVVAGHYSEVLCETQITGQFKDAFRQAFEADVAGVHMQQLHDRALTLGKRIRARQGTQVDGLPELVAATVRERMDARGRRVLLLGAGALGREMAACLAAVEGLDLTWANRSLDHIPSKPACARLALDDALVLLGDFDQVVTVLGTAEPVIRPRHVSGAGTVPLFIDLGLPRNVDARIGGRQGAEILDLSSFRYTGEDRERLLALADAMVLEGGAVHG